MYLIFQSSNKRDKCTRLSVLAKNELKAWAFAYKYFKEHNFKGRPVVLAL